MNLKVSAWQAWFPELGRALSAGWKEAQGTLVPVGAALQGLTLLGWCILDLTG